MQIDVMEVFFIYLLHLLVGPIPPVQLSHLTLFLVFFYQVCTFNKRNARCVLTHDKVFLWMVYWSGVLCLCCLVGPDCHCECVHNGDAA